MDGQNGDDLFPTKSHHSRKFHCYSDKFIINSDDDDEEDEASTNTRRFSFDAASSNHTKTPKIFDRFYNSSSDEGEDNGINGSSQNDSVQKRLDYMIQFLDRKLSSSSSPDRSKNQPLPEFIGTGGGTGVFKPPLRAPVHPGRPPSLEIRPHPLREGQVGCFLRNIVCVNDNNGSQLWAGSESGIRVWDLKNEMYSCGAEGGEEEGTARYWESGHCPATLCVVGDVVNRVVWSGHKDGRIRCWKMMNFEGNGTDTDYMSDFKEGLSWQAHRGPVFSIVMTSHGM